MQKYCEKDGNPNEAISGFEANNRWATPHRSGFVWYHAGAESGVGQLRARPGGLPIWGKMGNKQIIDATTAYYYFIGWYDRHPMGDRDGYREGLGRRRDIAIVFDKRWRGGAVVGNRTSRNRRGIMKRERRRGSKGEGGERVISQ